MLVGVILSNHIKMFDATKFLQSDNERFASFLNALVGANFIKNEDVSSIKSRFTNAEDLFEALMSLGHLDESSLAKYYAKAAQIPFIDQIVLDPKAYGLIDEGISKSFGFIPFNLDESNKNLQIAITDPIRLKNLNSQALEELEKKIGYKVEIFIAPRDHVIQAGANSVPENNQTVDLSKIPLDKENISKIPQDLAEKYKMVIFRKNEDGSYDIAVSNPSDTKTKEIIDYLRKDGGIRLNVYQAFEGQILAILKGEDVPQNQTTSLPGQIGEKKSEPTISNTNESVMENPDLVSFLNKKEVTVKDIEEYANREQIPQLLAAIIMLAVKDRSSDIHIEPFEKKIRLRFRVDGELVDIMLFPQVINQSIVARVKILSKLKIDEQRVPQDGRFEVLIGSEAIDIRVSTLPTIFGEKVEMRLLSKSKKIESLEDLGVDGLVYDRIISAVSQPNGVVLSTGPTGSGKTTTLYSILYRLNRPEVNIVTLEDPVEYEIPGINQTQIKPQIGFGFADGLRSILRQDPNIIMVGEIRDSETAELVTHAALTGHLVLSTLHTNDAASALPRLINLGVEPFLLSSAINAVMAQRLVRRVCPSCKEEIQVPDSVAFKVKKELENLNLNIPFKFYKGKGCPSCKNGFRGRVGIFEVLTMSETVEDMVLAKKGSQDILLQAVKEGMITMKQDGLIKALKGITTVDEVLRVTSQAKE